MNKAKDFLSKLVYNKFLWQLILAVFMIGMAIFFIKQEHIEVFKIKDQLADSQPVYITLGIILTVIYIAVQGLMYIYSFKALHKQIPFLLAINLFLKRNFVSVFLPAGGFSSLAFFTKDIENKGITKSQIHLASTIFGFCSVLSVVLVAIPVLGIALLYTKLGTAELLGFIFLLILTGFFIFLIYSISVKGLAYNWLSRTKPSLTTIMDEMLEEKINRKNFYLTLATSILIELIGIAHLYICMLALGFDASLPAAIIGYIVMVILLIASPFLRGLGAIEVSLTLVLQQFGFPIIAAATITLLFRFFEFWLPLFAGILSFITKKDNILLRILPAFIILILGVVNIISAISPAIPSRLRLMKNLIPEDIMVTSNSLILIFGLILVIISVFLLQGSKRAWYLAVSLTLFSVVGHLLKAADFEEAILAFVAAAILIYTKGSYKLKPHPKLAHFNITIFLYAIIAFIAYGVLGFYFIDKRHFGIDFELWDAFKAVLKLFFLFDDQSVTPLTKFGSRFVISIYFAGGSMILFFIYSLLKPYFSKPYNSPEEFEKAKEL
ncbi:MAG: lysylphosphatidylglycerol synthetase family protein, partial [Oligoflexus sp.]|nr:lysylphosphatidylglycerol synthetase family protein [Pseudopedobacter sp.]